MPSKEPIAGIVEEEKVAASEKARPMAFGAFGRSLLAWLSALVGPELQNPGLSSGESSAVL